MTYTFLFNETIRLYSHGQYKEAYQFITDHMNGFQDFDAHIYNLRFCTACKAGLTELAIQIMNEAILDKGLWYSYDYLYREGDLEAIKDSSEFIELTNVCKQRELTAKSSTSSDLLVIEPQDGKRKASHPLMMILHGNGQSIPIVKENWISCVNNNMILALPQSSQIEFSGAYVWNDYQLGHREIKSHYDRLVSEYNIDKNQIIIGGFSAGTRTALYSILNESILVKGFILHGSWLPELKEWEPMFDIIAEKDIKGYILCGEKDEISLEHSKKLITIFEEKNVKHKFHLIEGIGHEYPLNFDEYLNEAIDFILDN